MKQTCERTRGRHTVETYGFLAYQDVHACIIVVWLGLPANPIAPPEAVIVVDACFASNVRAPTMTKTNPGRCKSQPHIDADALETGLVPHFFDYLKKTDLAEVKIAVPTFNRPSKLCTATLPFLRRHGVRMDRIHLFMAPTAVSPDAKPQWYLYMQALRDHGFGGVRLEPGGDGLTAQMQSILKWAEPGTHVVIMTDDVTDIVEKKFHVNGEFYQSPLPNGAFDAVVGHESSSNKSCGA